MSLLRISPSIDTNIIACLFYQYWSRLERAVSASTDGECSGTHILRSAYAERSIYVNAYHRTCEPKRWVGQDDDRCTSGGPSWESGGGAGGARRYRPTRIPR